MTIPETFEAKLMKKAGSAGRLATLMSDAGIWGMPLHQMSGRRMPACICHAQHHSCQSRPTQGIPGAATHQSCHSGMGFKELDVLFAAFKTFWSGVADSLTKIYQSSFATVKAATPSFCRRHAQSMG